jgi:hypothetical protein
MSINEGKLIDVNLIDCILLNMELTRYYSQLIINWIYQNVAAILKCHHTHQRRLRRTFHTTNLWSQTRSL